MAISKAKLLDLNKFLNNFKILSKEVDAFKRNNAPLPGGDKVFLKIWELLLNLKLLDRVVHRGIAERPFLIFEESNPYFVSEIKRIQKSLVNNYEKVGWKVNLKFVKSGWWLWEKERAIMVFD